jgi:hypothetical protein
MKRRWLVVGAILAVGLFACLGIVFVAGIFALTQPVVDASEQFLGLLGLGKTAEAYALTAEGFRAQQDEASFAGAVKQLGLTEYASASWHSRQIDNNEGSAEGTVTTKSGTTKPVSFRLVREGGKWAVVTVRYGGFELVTFQAASTLPSKAEVERMVTESLLGFNEAVRSKNFVPFYGKLSELWKKDTTPQRLQKSFQEFVDKDIDIGSIKNLTPHVSPSPALNDKGFLQVAGRYPTQPAQVRFELKYAQERGHWKLSGISVGIGGETAE